MKIPIAVVLSLLLCLWLAQVTDSQEEEQCEDDSIAQQQAQHQQQQQQQGSQQGYNEPLVERKPNAHIMEMIHAAEVKYSDNYPCHDDIKTCPNLAKDNGCIENFFMMRQKCRKTCMLCMTYTWDDVKNIYSIVPQKTQGENAFEVRKHILETDGYMYNEVYVEEQYASVRSDCKNRDELCSFWAQGGECYKNKEFMLRQCAPACFSCHVVSHAMRCPYNPDDPIIFNTAGDVHAMFTRIVTDPVFRERYRPVIYSQPKNITNTSNNKSKSSKEPWVVVLDNFLTAEECETLINLGTAKGYELSLDVGPRNFDGTYQSEQSKERTSTNAWCTEDCWEHSVTQTVHDYMENVTRIPRINYEYLQLLRYEVEQFYGRHHDFVPHHMDRSCGPRILTVFLYLNDVEEGGGTNFPLLQTVRVFHSSVIASTSMPPADAQYIYFVPTNFDTDSHYRLATFSHTHLHRRLCLNEDVL